MGEADLVGGVESDGAVERGAGGRRGGGGRGGRGEASGVSVGEADALVEHERGVHELKAHILVVGLEVNEEGAGLLEGEGEASQGRTVGEGGLGGGGLKAEVAGGGGEGGGGRGLVALVAALERGLHLPFQSADPSLKHDKDIPRKAEHKTCRICGRIGRGSPFHAAALGD